MKMFSDSEDYKVHREDITLEEQFKRRGIIKNVDKKDLDGLGRLVIDGKTYFPHGGFVIHRNTIYVGFKKLK